MLREGVYPYKYINIWERFNETLPDTKEFYSSLNMGDITHADHKHTKRVWKNFKIKRIMIYTFKATCLLLADVFESFCNKCIKICEVDSAHFF